MGLPTACAHTWTQLGLGSAQQSCWNSCFSSASTVKRISRPLNATWPLRAWMFNAFSLIHIISGSTAAFLRKQDQQCQQLRLHHRSEGFQRYSAVFCQRHSLSCGNLTPPVLEQEQQKVCSSTFGQWWIMLMAKSLAAPGCCQPGKAVIGAG